MAEKEHDLPGIVVLTHGEFGKELIRSAEMIIGAQPNVKAVSLLPGMDLAAFIAQVRAELAEFPAGSLLISDLFGGTPANVSAAILAEQEVQAISGLNMAMLIEACTLRSAMAGRELAAAVLGAGVAGCKDLRQALADSGEENII